MKNTSRKCILIAAVIITSTFAARAVSPTTTENSEISGSGDFNDNTELEAISSTDMLEAGSSALSSVAVNNPPDSSYGTTAGINDGTGIENGDANFAGSAYYGYNSSANGGAPKANLLVDNQLAGAGEIITFNLNTNPGSGGSALGYNINTLTTIAGWQDHPSVADQDYTITYTLVGVPGTFTLGSVAYNPFDPSNDPVSGAGPGYGSLVSWTGLGLVGVSSITFDFTPDPASAGYGQSGTGLWLQEIDGFGSATPAPEPSTWAMMIVGAAGVLALSIRRLMRA